MGDVLSFTERGIYCAAADVYIDPWRPVPRALITHAHSDHARPGMGAYLCTEGTAPVLRHRLGDVAVETIRYGTVQRIGDADISFHPAGHVPGSAQIRVAVDGQVWVVSGDYKTDADGLTEPFEPVACHAFISECTFGLPVFRWAPQAKIAKDMLGWWQAAAAEGKTAMLGTYALGKAQRVMSMLAEAPGPILTHGAVEGVTEVLRGQGLVLPKTIPVTPDLDPRAFPGALVIAPPSALGSTWARRFGPVTTAFASGWMQVRGMRRRRAADRGFVLSDHADWAGLNTAVRATSAERVFVTHGYTSVFRQWLVSQGYDAQIVSTEYEGEAVEGSGEAAEAEP